MNTTAQPRGPLFEVRDVGRVFRGAGRTPVSALGGVSLVIPRGACLVLTGPSGCGKTTLLALFGALDRPSHGDVIFDGRDLGGVSEAERSRARRRIGMVFQRSPLIDGLPLWENVTYPLVPRGVSTRERRTIARQLLERVGIGARDDSTPAELSGGEQQRVGIARALVSNPEALLADEPTSDLDRDSAAAVVALIREFHATGRTVVVATHDPAIEALATHTQRLHKGKLA